MADESFVCPECSQQFDRPQSLGAHRYRKHGVSGSSTRAGARQKKRQSQPAQAEAIVNRDALLKAIFPQGIPPREEVLSQTSQWLEEAERLAHV